jgi:ABC-type nitrate/sulfonate/bicarbonate transport system permease component
MNHSGNDNKMVGTQTTSRTFIVGFAAGCIIGSLVSTAIDLSHYRMVMRQQVQERMEIEAVFAGHAEWVEGKDGRPQFSWRDCK